RAGEVEREPDAPLDPQPGVHRALRRNLVGCALAEEAPLAGVDALRVLAHDDAVDPIVQGAWSRLERTQIDVEVELEPEAQEQAPLEDARWDVGRSDRTEEDGVEPADLAQDLVGKDFAGAQVTGSAQVVGDGLVRDAGRVDDLEGLGHHLGADAVTTDDPDRVRHGCRPCSWFPENEKPPTELDGRGRSPATAFAPE